MEKEKLKKLKHVLKNYNNKWTKQQRYDKEKLQERLLNSWWCSYYSCRWNTETEMKEKKDRVDDALHATKAALKKVLYQVVDGFIICFSDLKSILQEQVL